MKVKDYKLEPCPFCGEELVYVFKLGDDKHYPTVSEWRHPDGDRNCVLRPLNVSLRIDAPLHRDNWNKRVERKL